MQRSRHKAPVADGTLGPKALIGAYALASAGLVGLVLVRHPTLATDLFLLTVAPALGTLWFQTLTGGRRLEEPDRAPCTHCGLEGEYRPARLLAVRAVGVELDIDEVRGPACPECLHELSSAASQMSAMEAWRSPITALAAPGVVLHNLLQALFR